MLDVPLLVIRVCRWRKRCYTDHTLFSVKVMMIRFMNTDLVMSSMRDGLADGNPSVTKWLWLMGSAAICDLTQCYLHEDTHLHVFSLNHVPYLKCFRWKLQILWCIVFRLMITFWDSLNWNLSSDVWHRLAWWMYPCFWSSSCLHLQNLRKFQTLEPREYVPPKRL